MRPIYSTEDRDQVIHAITQVLEFFGKGADPDSVRMWLWSFQDHEPQVVIEALRQSIKQCEFAPRPAKIIKIIEEMREQKGQRFQSLPEPPKGDAAPIEVSRAWTWVIRQWGKTGEALFSDPKLTEEEVEEALMLVNQQASKSRKITAIPEHCFLESIWGCSYEDAVSRYADKHDNQKSTRRAA